MRLGSRPDIRQIFLEARRLPREERAAFVARACKGEPELQAELEELLGQDEQDDGFLDNPPWTTGGFAPPAIDVGSRIGPYRLVRRLGRGGMGVVFVAEEEGTQVHVALKTVQLTDGGLLETIRREIHALARLRHPGIVRIVNEGIHEGIPWYAMELVDGTTLDRHARRLLAHEQAVGPPDDGGGWWTTLLLATPSGHELQGAATPKRSPLRGEALLETLSVVRRLCRALAYMHGEGIVHRDLKPQNILVRGDGMPVLVDFGLMQSFGGELSREPLELSGCGGTVAYIAPEQARRLPVDARADLFSLGCMLYELVTGRQPFVGPTPAKALEQRFCGEPMPPSALVDGLSPELEQLILRLLRREPRDRLGYAEDVARALEAMGASDGPLGPEPRPYLYRPGFAGREDSMRILEAQLSRLDTGIGGMVLLSGESGVGKTRLAVALASKATDSLIPVLVGECVPSLGQASEALGGDRGPLQALRRPLCAIGDRLREAGAEATQRILGNRAAVLGLYEPSLGTLPGLDPVVPAEDLPPEEARLRLFRYLREVLAALSHERPVLLIIDDLQWADELTMGFLAHLVGTAGLERVPLLVLGTYRSEEAPPELARLSAANGVLDLHLDRLGEREVRDIVSNMLALDDPPQDFVTFLARHTEGNPFFVAEYLRAAVAEAVLLRDSDGRWQLTASAERAAARYATLQLPRSVRDVVARRIDGLGSAAASLLEVAAVLGRDIDSPMLRLASGLEEQELMTAMGELLVRQILEEPEPGRYGFLHAKIREVAYERVEGHRLRDLHRAAAEAMERRYEGERDQHLAAMGHHWEKGGESARALACYLPAARQAKRVHSYEEAERLYRAYLQLMEHPTRESIAARNQLGAGVLMILGRTQDAEEQHRIALSEACALGDAIAEGSSQGHIGQVLLARGKTDDAARLLQEALAKLGEDARAADVLRTLASLHAQRGSMEAAEECCTRALAIARRVGDREQEGAFLMQLGTLKSEQGQIDQARGHFERALAVCRDLKVRRLEGSILGNMAVLLWSQGRLDDARVLHERALAIQRQVGARESEGRVLINLALVHQEQRRMNDALEAYAEALAISREIGNRRLEGVALGNMALLRVEQGKPGDARPMYEEALSIHREVGDRRFEGIVLGNLGSLELAQGNLEEARRRCEEALSIRESAGDRRGTGQVLGHLAAIGTSQGRMDEAREMFARALAILREVGDKRFEGLTLRGLARHELLSSGDDDRAERLAREGQALLEGVGDALEAGIFICIRGHIALARGSSAHDLLEQAARTAAATAPESSICQAVATLRRAQLRFQAGEPLSRGFSPEDLPPAVMAWLRHG